MDPFLSLQVIVAEKQQFANSMFPAKSRFLPAALPSGHRMVQVLVLFVLVLLVLGKHYF